MVDMQNFGNKEENKGCVKNRSDTCIGSIFLMHHDTFFQNTVFFDIFLYNYIDRKNMR